MARQALNPRPGGPSHVHPHLPDPCQLSQHQTVHRGLSWKAVSGGDQLLPHPIQALGGPSLTPAEQEFWPLRAASLWAMGQLENKL